MRTQPMPALDRARDPAAATLDARTVSRMTQKTAADSERYFKSMSCKSKLIVCPVCQGSGRNPEAPAVAVDDDGNCLVCCFPLHPLYAAHHGHVRPIA